MVKDKSWDRYLVRRKRRDKEEVETGFMEHKEHITMEEEMMANPEGKIRAVREREPRESVMRVREKHPERMDSLA